MNTKSSAGWVIAVIATAIAIVFWISFNKVNNENKELRGDLKTSESQVEVLDTKLNDANTTIEDQNSNIEDAKNYSGEDYYSQQDALDTLDTYDTVE